MATKDIRWGAALAAALAAEVALVAAAFAWVAIYSHVLHPGESLAFYQEYAQASGPWVSILAGAPVFYVASRWIARPWPTAMAFFGVYVVGDTALLVAFAGEAPLPLGLVVTSYLVKFAASSLGGRGRGNRSTIAGHA